MKNSTISKPINLNQKNIQDFLDCPRKFQLNVLENLSWPAAISDHLEKIEHSIYLGNQFHLVCHQYFSGVSPALLDLSIDDPDLKIMWGNFLPFGKSLIEFQSYPEQLLSYTICDQRLIAKFDLIVRTSSDKYIILDWKTGFNKPSRELISSRVQSFLYPFIFSLSGAELYNEPIIKPDHVEMHYFYPFSSEPHEVFPYSEEAHVEIRTLLEKIISDISKTIESSELFPLVEDPSQCKYCIYRSLCDRGVNPGNFESYLPVDHENLSNEIFELEQVGELEF